MFEKINSGGFYLVELGHDHWCLESGGTYVPGSFRAVVTYMVTHHGFHLNEINIACKEMLAKDHNAAHFGIYKKLIFTCNRQVEQKVG